MKKAIKTTAVALAAASLLMTQSAHSTGIPTFDGGSFMGAIQELMNWQARFQSLIRDKLSQIPGVKEYQNLKSLQSKVEIEKMFVNRKRQCNRIKNKTSADFCRTTVDLEREKYLLLQRMNTDITAEFNRINGRISSQADFVNQTGGLPAMPSFGGMQGMAASVIPSSPGKAESAEQDVQIQIQGLLAKIEHYKSQLDTIDRHIEQLKWARKQITKDHFAGNPSLFSSSTISKGVAASWLEIQAREYREKAKNKWGENATKSRNARNTVIQY